MRRTVPLGVVIVLMLAAFVLGLLVPRPHASTESSSPPRTTPRTPLATPTPTATVTADPASPAPVRLVDCVPTGDGMTMRCGRTDRPGEPVVVTVGVNPDGSACVWPPTGWDPDDDRWVPQGWKPCHLDLAPTPGAVVRNPPFTG